MMMLGDFGQSLGITGPHGSPQVVGLLAKVLGPGLFGKRDGRQRDSFRTPGVRVARPKGGIAAIWSITLSGGLCPSREPEASRRPTGIITLLGQAVTAAR
jgi:hypothetical protein